MANCAISNVHSDGTKKVLERDDHSRMAAMTKMRYIAARPTRRLAASTART